MAEPLKEMFNPNVVRTLGTMLRSSWSAFDTAAFQRDALHGLADLELLPRARHIAAAIAAHLPSDPARALDIIIAALPTPPTVEENHDVTSFLYMPLTIYVSEHGLGEFDKAMRANYELTKRFTAEFSIRPFLIHHEERTLALLHAWTEDADHHVRRLVSEGTRPRLPWAPRLPQFQRDPKPVLALLERLKDDPSLYVRRSVANNLNDIGKDNLDVLVSTASRWLKGASEDRQWVVRHALRSAIKRGEPSAFAVLGFDTPADVAVTSITIHPSVVPIGNSVRVMCTITNKTPVQADVLLDLAVHFVKANGSTSMKVFKLTTAALEPGASVDVRKTISVRQHTTRTHYPGEHRVELLVNNVPHTLGSFTLVADTDGDPTSRDR